MFSNHLEITIEQTLKHLALCEWSDKRNRFEVTVPSVPEKGYGATEEQAFAMMRKILKNKALKRPLLEDIEEHENYSANASKSASAPNIVYNIGVMNAGSMSHIQSMNIAVSQSTQQLQQSQPILSEQLRELAAIATDSTELSETQKVEALDYVDIIAKEAEKPGSERLAHRIINSLKGLKEIFVGLGAAKELLEKAEPAIRALLSHAT